MFNKSLVTTILHFGASHDQATIFTPGGRQTVDLSQFRSKMPVVIQGQNESPSDFRKRHSDITKHSLTKANHQRHAALELITEFVCRQRGLSYGRA